MGFSLRRSIKLGPFGRIYLGKKGPSLSVGVRGAHVNFGSRGTRMTVGVPGTGLSYSQKLGLPATAPAKTTSLDGCLLLIAACIAFGIFVACIEANAIATVAVMIAAGAGWLFVSKKIAAGKRLEAEERFAAQCRRLAELYGEENVDLLLAGKPWIGCSLPMVVEMLGRPVSIDETVLRTKTKLTYKYRQFGQNRFGLRVFLEDGIVAGWEEKDEQ